MSTIHPHQTNKKILKEPKPSQKLKYKFLQSPQDKLESYKTEYIPKSTLLRQKEETFKLPPIKQKNHDSSEKLMTDDIFMSYRSQNKSKISQKNKITSDNTIGLPLVNDIQSLLKKFKTRVQNVEGKTELEIKINKMLICHDFIEQIPAPKETKKILSDIKKTYEFCAQGFLEEYLQTPLSPIVGEEIKLGGKIQQNLQKIKEIDRLEVENKELSKKLKADTNQLEYLKNYKKYLSSLNLNVRPRGIAEKIESKRKELYNKMEKLNQLRTNFPANYQPREQLDQIVQSRTEALGEITDLGNQNKVLEDKIEKMTKDATNLFDLIGLDDSIKSWLIKNAHELQHKEREDILNYHPFLGNLLLVDRESSSLQIPKWNFYIS